MANLIHYTDYHCKSKQQGAVAIEFASLFLLFFVVFYALVTYAVALLLQLAMVHAATEGARSAIAVDPLAFSSSNDYINNGVQPRVRSTAGAALAWLPTKAKEQVLGANNALVQTTIVNNVLTVRLDYANYAANPLLPVLNMPFIGPVPKLPTNLVGTAQLTLSS
jgi:Flp pilus assembly protein TadG